MKKYIKKNTPHDKVVRRVYYATHLDKDGNFSLVGSLSDCRKCIEAINDTLETGDYIVRFFIMTSSEYILQNDNE